MFSETAPAYSYMLYPAKSVEHAYWNTIEDLRGADFGVTSHHRGECTIRILSMAHTVFQAMYALLATVPVIASSMWSLYRHRDGDLTRYRISQVALLTFYTVWLPTVCSIMVAANPACLDRPGSQVRQISNVFMSDLLFQTSS